MKINITGRHMHVHDSVKDYALEKAEKLERFNDHIQHTEIVLANEGDRKTVEMIVTTRRGGKHVGQVEHEDTFAAIDLLMDKMKRQLEDLSLRVISGTPADLAKLIADDTEKWAKVVKFAGIKAD